MKDLNLLPESKNKNLERAKPILAGLLVLFISAMFVNFGIIDPIRQRNDAEIELQNHVTQMDILRAREAEHTELTTQLDLLRVRIANLEGLFAGDIPLSDILVAINNFTSIDLVITNKLYIEEFFEIQGRVISHLEIADFSESLSETDLFDIVRILRIDREAETGAYTFIMNLRLNQQ